MTTLKQLKLVLNEVLSPEEAKSVQSWPRNAEAHAATDHFFGKDNEDRYTPLEGTTDKSEIHKQIENHLGKQIHINDYKEGKTTDEYNRPVKIGKLLAKTKAPDELKRNLKMIILEPLRTLVD